MHFLVFSRSVEKGDDFFTFGVTNAPCVTVCVVDVGSVLWLSLIVSRSSGVILVT